MDKHDQLEELLVDWEQHRRQGSELSVEELCKENPELVPEISKLISDFKATDWLEEDDESDDDFLSLPDFSTVSGHADETRLPECKLSLDEFCQRLVDSELMGEEQVGGFRQRISADDARSFAQQLVSEKRLTRFQATVLLEGRDIPLVLDRYVLLGEIGKGGMGAVYKALHQQMDRVVALKILPKEAVDSPEKVKRFHREVKAAAKLEHPNIVTAFDAREDKGFHFFVMSLVNGSDLSDVVRKQGPVSPAKAVDYIAQAARGLDHAHNMGIVHRDIKPGNLLLSKKGKVKILDMGLARIDGGDPEHDKTMSMELTQAGMVMGTIAYLAPEQALDTRTADARSDIYSLGCTLYYLLTGKAMYSENTLMKTIMAHREGEIPSLCEEREGVPAELDAVFQKMVAKQPEDRFQSMVEVISALEELDIKDDDGTQPVVAGSQAYHDTATFIDTSRDVIEPQPSPQGIGTGSGKHKILIFAAAAAFILLAGIIYRIQTNKGTITVELADESIAAKLTTSGVIIEDGDREWTINIGDSKPLPAGDTYSARLPKDSGLMLTVTDDNGTELETGKFQIRRNGKILVKLTATGEAVAQTRTPSSPDEIELRGIANSDTAVDRNRLVAETVLRRGGAVSFFNSSSGSSMIDEVDHIPNERFALYKASLSNCVSPLTTEEWHSLCSAKPLHCLQCDRMSISQNSLSRIGQLQCLQRLELSLCQLTDSNVIHLAALRDLRILSLAGNQGVTDKSCETLLNLDELRELHIHGTQITGLGLAKLAQLPKLKLLQIDLSNGIEAADLQALNSSESLQFLHLLDKSVDDTFVEDIGKLSHLRVIKIDTTSVTNRGARRLRELLPNCLVLHPSWTTEESDVRAAQFIVKHGGAFRKQGSSEIYRSIPQQPFAIEAVQFYATGDPPSSGAGQLKGLPHLEALQWEGLKDVDSECATIGTLKNLRRIRLGYTDISEAGLKHLKTLPLLEELWVWSPSLTDDALPHLADIEHLQILEVMNAGISDDGLEAVGRCYGLRMLNIGRCNNIHGNGLEHLVALKSLRQLQLGGSPITDNAIPHLERMRSLRVLQIYNTKITAIGAARLQSMMPDCVVFHESLAHVPWPPEHAHNWPEDQPAPAIAPFTPEEAKQHQEAWAKHLGVPVEMENSIGMKFRVIPPGEFLMGSSEEEIANLLEEAEEKENLIWAERLPFEAPRHRVILAKTFMLGIHEVTRGQFRQFVEATGYKTDAEKDGKGGKGIQNGVIEQLPKFVWNADLGYTNELTDDHPVANVSWHDADAFCDWLSRKEGVKYRLPTEAEWEFSCRAGATTNYLSGDTSSLLTAYAWFAEKKEGGPHAVGKKSPNAFGLHDTSGNVWEWCFDGHEKLPADDTVDPHGPADAPNRIWRGGEYTNQAEWLRCSFRNYAPPNTSTHIRGFRIVRTFEKYEPKKPETAGPAVAPKPDESSGIESSKIGDSEKKTDNE